MANHLNSLVFFLIVMMMMMMISMFMIPVSSELTPDFYNDVCPDALPTINILVNAAIALDPRMGASLLRLHFHDCFVNVYKIKLLIKLYVYIYIYVINERMHAVFWSLIKSLKVCRVVMDQFY